jgi:hypothetical protein
MTSVFNNFMRNGLKSGGQTERIVSKTMATTSAAVGKTPVINDSVSESQFRPMTAPNKIQKHLMTKNKSQQKRIDGINNLVDY